MNLSITTKALTTGREGMKMLTQARLKELLHYDRETGLFSWVVKRNGSRPTVGSVNSRGYLIIGIYGRVHSSHRLAWLYVTGSWPQLAIDHIDGNKTNNSWANLREASPAQNAANKGRPSTNTSGYKGVSWHKHHQKWQAQIRKDGKLRHLGEFDTAAEAHVVYCSAATELFGEFARS